MDLEQVISELVPTASTKRHTTKLDERHPVIDHHALLEGFDGNRGLLKEMARLFLADYPRRVEEIKESIRRGNATALERAAHALKGSVGNFAAKEASAMAQRLEDLGRNGQLDAAGEGCIELESELALVAKELRRLIANPSQTRTRPARRARGQARKPT
jgi:HPt (histidine-containing phosphotransfer) domain-containing protein